MFGKCIIERNAVILRGFLYIKIKQDSDKPTNLRWIRSYQKFGRRINWNADPSDSLIWQIELADYHLLIASAVFLWENIKVYPDHMKQ